jgi:hypothetical protein
MKPDRIRRRLWFWLMDLFALGNVSNSRCRAFRVYLWAATHAAKHEDWEQPLP